MSELKERKTDGRLAEWIEVLEDSSGDGNDNTLLVLLLELRAFRRTRDKERERITELEAELARRDASAGEPDYYIHRVEVCDSYGPDVELRAFNNALDASKCKDDHGGEVVELFAYPPAPSAPDGWINCSERMPDDSQWCVVNTEYGYYVQCWGSVQGWLGDDISIPNCDVSHWMPLPAAPGGD